MSQGDGGGCLQGCFGFTSGKSKPSKEPLRLAPPLDDSELLKQLEGPVQEAISQNVKGLEESLSRELQGVLTRLLKVDAPLSPIADAADLTRGSKCKSMDEPELSAHNRPDFSKRRWTAAADGTDSLAAIMRRAALNQEKAEQQVSDSSQDDQDEFSRPSSRSSVRKAMSERSVTFDRKTFTDDAEEEEDLEPHHGAVGSNEQSDLDVGETSSKSGSSAVFRVDSLDFGDRLAATAAAKKGNATVDSIVELVQTERERWAQEKLELEARLDELKQVQQKQLSQLGQDAEKEALKAQAQELRDTMKARSRFGAWVCERHMDASDDEEEDSSGLAKEELRQQLSNLQKEVRKAKQKPGTG